MRTCLSLLAAICILALPGSVLADPNSATLRDFGNIGATFRPGRATFACDSELHASNLLGKLRADMFWDAPADHTQTTVKFAGRDVPIDEWKPYGAVSLARIGEDVVVVSAATIPELTHAIASDPQFVSASAKYVPDHAYPRSLDFYDLGAFKCYAHAMTSPENMGLASHWPFVKKFGTGGLVFQGLDLPVSNPAPGVFDWSAMDYEMKQAEQIGGGIIPATAIGGEMPFWAANDHPENMMKPAPTALLGAWGNTPSTAGSPFESWGAPDSELDTVGLAFMRAEVEHFGNSPALMGWFPYAGSPGDEYGFHEATDEFWDYSPAGEESFRAYLRDTMALSLSALGLRWHGDPHYFKSWNQVEIPNIQGFFGDLSGSSFLIDTGWQWRQLQATDTAPPASNADGWANIASPPSQQAAYLPWGPSYYRVTVDPSRWLATNTGKAAYLVVTADFRSSSGVAVWLNGNNLGQFKSSNGEPGPFAINIAGLLKSGENELALSVPGAAHSGGKILGPTYLTTTQPSSYPHLGSLRNAQYVDIRKWQCYQMSQYHAKVFAEVRRLDPNCPVISSTDNFDLLGDYTSDMASRYNLGVEMTGREAYYFPRFSGLGYVAGFYSTGETSNLVVVPNLDRMLRWIFYDGDSSQALFWDVEQYIKYEQETGWFTAHQKLYALGRLINSNPFRGVVNGVST